MNIYVALGLIGVGLLVWWWFRPVHDVKKAREFMERVEQGKKNNPLQRRVLIKDEYHSPLTPQQVLDDGYYYKRPSQDQSVNNDSCMTDLPHRSSSRSSMCDYSPSSSDNDSSSGSSGGSSSRGGDE